jgi:hypothetical protein
MLILMIHFLEISIHLLVLEPGVRFFIVQVKKVELLPRISRRLERGEFSIARSVTLSRLERGTAGLCVQEMVFHPVVRSSTASIQYIAKGDFCTLCP